MFGHPIMMNYNQETTFNTLEGGVVSLFLNAFLVWLSITQFLSMLEHGNDTIMANQTTTDFEKIGSISLEKSNNIPFYRFFYKGKMLKADEHPILKEHIHINFEQIYVDHNS